MDNIKYTVCHCAKHGLSFRLALALINSDLKKINKIMDAELFGILAKLYAAEKAFELICYKDFLSH